MFKRLRDRIAEEATKFPGSQTSSNSNKQSTESENKLTTGSSTEDLITLNESSSSVVVPQTIPQQFSIGDEDDGSVSPSVTPFKKQNDSANGLPNDQSTQGHNSKDSILSPGSDFVYVQEYKPTKSNYIPQSDIESEREEPPTLNLEGISKDQLLTIIDMLKAKSCKYKNKYIEVVKNYKDLRDEKIKIENTLTEYQDKGLRRIGELREQCQLEQKAKAHLEAELQLQLEEKDSRISVLETQINLLKETDKSSLIYFASDDNISQNSESSNIADHEKFCGSCDDKEKLERLEHQLTQAKKTLKSQTDQISLLRKQNESISEELEKKIKLLDEAEEIQASLISQHELTLASLQVRLKELENQQEESVMAMAETKKNMHEELEFKEKQLTQAKEETKHFQLEYEAEKLKVCEMQKHHKKAITELENRLESTEKMLEDEKENLMQELTRGKTAALNLVQQEWAKKVASVEEELKSKLEESQTKVDTWIKKYQILEEELKQSNFKIEDLNNVIEQLERERAELKAISQKTESENAEAQLEDNLVSMKDKLDTAEKNYQTHINEMKSRIMQLEKENNALNCEKAELLKVQDKLSELKTDESSIRSQLKLKEDEMNKLQQKYESIHKDQCEKIRGFQETMKDKENMIRKLQANYESLKKENLERNEEFKKKIKSLEEEQEKLMIQAQERVSTTEAKCREDMKALQERNNKLTVENAELEKLKSKCASLSKELTAVRHSLNQSLVSEKELFLKLEERFVIVNEKLSNCEERNQVLEVEVKRLQDENSLLVGKSTNFESLKAEKEELNEKLKQVERQVTSVKELENERNSLKAENSAILKKLEMLQSNYDSTHSAQEGEHKKLLLKIEQITQTNDGLNSELISTREAFEKEKCKLVSEKEELLKKLSSLEAAKSKDSTNTDMQDYVAIIRKECDDTIKSKEEEMEQKLKLLVRDFSQQMDEKDKDSDKILSETIEKYQETESKLTREHHAQMTELRQDLFQQECALDDMRDSYEETLKEKENQIKELQSTVKKLNETFNHPASSTDSAFGGAESSDWDDTWVVPDECVESTSPIHASESCKEHLLAIENLKEELAKSNSEVKELKILLRLSPPESMVDNNNRRDSMQSVVEPTEFEYLKNIIFEYMMGKEPITLVKVIAAVLRFSDSQTQEVIRREEAKHPAR